MTEPLVVDPTRLKTAATKLGELSFPAPPSSISVSGTDPVSAAINETMPVIETPVIDGLPAVEAANARTGSSIAIAAGIYADTDQRLAEHVSTALDGSAGQTRLAAAAPRLGATATGLTAAEDTGNKDDTDNKEDGTDTDQPKDIPAPPPQPAPIPTPSLPSYADINKQLAQAAAMSKAMGPMMQNVQSVMSSVQGSMGGMGGGGGAPTQLASASSAAESAADEGRLVDDTKPDDKPEDEKPEDEAVQDPDAAAEGAAAGEHASEGVPLQTAPGRPQMTPSGSELV